MIAEVGSLHGPSTDSRNRSSASLQEARRNPSDDKPMTSARFELLECRPKRTLTSTFVLARWCRRGDLNPHALAGTSPSSWRVYLFRHSDVAT
jgi:hypothetical protein